VQGKEGDQHQGARGHVVAAQLVVGHREARHEGDWRVQPQRLVE
jgi:hypothetical protein